MTAPSPKEALEPCPFCGGKGRLYQSQNAAALWRVCCENCDAGPHSHIGHEEAIKRWNTRATLSPPAGERREAIARIVRDAMHDEPYYFDSFKERTEYRRERANKAADAILASGLVQDEAGWRGISSAPKDRTVIFVRRDNGCGTDYMVVWWSDTHNDGYPWRSDNNAYVEDRWDEWMLPPIRSARDGGEA